MEYRDAPPSSPSISRRSSRTTTVNAPSVQSNSNLRDLLNGMNKMHIDNSKTIEMLQSERNEFITALNQQIFDKRAREQMRSSKRFQSQYMDFGNRNTMWGRQNQANQQI
jgi:hypothetical protein